MRIVNSNISFFIFAVLINLLGIHLKFSLQELRLPTNLSPEHYHLRIFSNPDAENPEFWGDVKIRIKCNENTNKIVLNNRGLAITEENVTVNLVNSNVEMPIYQQYPLENDQYLIILYADLENGNKYDLYIQFQGQFSDDSRGFILISQPFNDEDEIIYKFQAVTQLAESDARRVFPCFDQIDMKAQFTIYIGHPKEFKSFSNMKRLGFQNLQQYGEWIITKFAESDPIPPCLVTIALVPKIYYSNLNLPAIESETPIVIYAHGSDRQAIKFGVAILLRSFIFYKNYFITIPYALSQLKVIVFPDFGNTEAVYYGLIPVGRSSLIVDRTPPIGSIQFSAAVDICHLISHQWIVTYATMSSWNEYWLHEALALHLSVNCVTSVRDYSILSDRIRKYAINECHIFEARLTGGEFQRRDDEWGWKTRILLAWHSRATLSKNNTENHNFVRKFDFIRKIATDCLLAHLKTHGPFAGNGADSLHKQDCFPASSDTQVNDISAYSKNILQWDPAVSEIHIAEDFFSALSGDQAGLIDKSPDSVDEYPQQSWKTDYLQKGQQLIRMLNFFLGDELFKSCISIYLKTFRFKNSTISDLWRSFSETASEILVLPEGLTIETIMDSWTKQTGYPLITVMTDHEAQTVSIKQVITDIAALACKIKKSQRFMHLDELNPGDPGSSHTLECWNIPLSYYKIGELEAESYRPIVWVPCGEPLVIHIDFHENEWILVNLNFNVLSRTDYNEENWNLLQKTLLDPQDYLLINTMTRAKLVSDISELSRLGILPYRYFFTTISYLVHEKFLLPWKIVSKELETIRIQLFQSNVLNLYTKYIRQILDLAFNDLHNINIVMLSKTDYEYLENDLKKIIAELSVNFGVEMFRAQCILHFDDFSEKAKKGIQNPIPQGVRHIVYCNAIKNDSPNDWNFLWSRYDKDNPSTENDIILEALGCSPKIETLENYLQWSLDEKIVAPLDNFKVFKSLVKNKEGYKLMKEFLFIHIEEIYVLNQEADLSIDPYLTILLDNTIMESDMAELKYLTSTNGDKLNNLNKVWNHHVKVASRNVLWLQKNEAMLLEIFQNM